MTKAQIKAELDTLKARALQLERIAQTRPWNAAELREIRAAADRDQTLRSRLATCP